MKGILKYKGGKRKFTSCTGIQINALISVSRIEWPRREQLFSVFELTFVIRCARISLPLPNKEISIDTILVVTLLAVIQLISPGARSKIAPKKSIL